MIKRLYQNIQKLQSFKVKKKYKLLKICLVLETYKEILLALRNAPEGGKALGRFKTHSITKTH